MAAENSNKIDKINPLKKKKGEIFTNNSSKYVSLSYIFDFVRKNYVMPKNVNVYILLNFI